MTIESRVFLRRREPKTVRSSAALGFCFRRSAATSQKLTHYGVALTSRSGEKRFFFKLGRVDCRPASQRITVAVAEHLAATDMVGAADDAVFLHPLDQPRGRIVPDPHLALQP